MGRFISILILTSSAVIADIPQQAPPVADLLPQAPPTRLFPPDLPDGSEKYEPTRWTQSIYVLSGHDTIDRVPTNRLDSKWHQSGGMAGINGVTSEKYRLLPEAPREWIGTIQVWNGSNYQPNRGLLRTYADGTRFDDVLSYRGQVFEHRTREKRGGRWSAKVIYSDHDARPPGYNGLQQTCASCHDEAGSGGYATGLVPGSDETISDPLPWHLVGTAVERTEQFFEPMRQGYGGTPTRSRTIFRRLR